MESGNYEAECTNCELRNLRDCAFFLVSKILVNQHNSSSDSDPFLLSQLIYLYRDNARDSGCPFVNEIDPNYNGRNTL